MVHEPWIGPAWASHDVRFCLIGESHYITDPADDSSHLTADIIRDVRDGRRKLPFYTKVATLLNRPESPADSTLWDRLAFFNFVPTSVGTESTAVPTAEMWQDGVARFQNFLVEHKPTHVLSLGQRQWNHFEFPPNWRSDAAPSDDAIRIWHTPGGNRIAASWINHPSSHGFSVDHWRPRVNTLLATSV